MANYVKATDFQAKDALITGNPSKIIKGQEINDEFNAIQTAIATKADTSSPALLGNPTAPTQASGNNTTRLATTAFVQGEIDAAQAAVAITGGTIDGVTITGGSVSGLATDITVPDGGTGASSLPANRVILGNGTGALDGNTVAPSTSGNVLTSNGTTWQSSTNARIGTNQTWQNVLASRASGANYTNSTGVPIMVTASIQSTNGWNYITAVVDGVTVGRGEPTSPSSTSGGSSVSFIVPNGSTYSITLAGSAVFYHWAELR